MDGIVSLARIAEVIRAMGSPDVICLQEVSRGLDLAGGGAPDQPAELAALFPGYEPIFGIAVDADPGMTGRRWQFGNLVLSRFPVVAVQHHMLPRPPVAATRHMARQATEVVVLCPSAPLRVMNTHLEFHSIEQRTAQVERLRMVLEAASGHANYLPPVESEGPYRQPVAPAGSVICGDFNMTVGSAEYRKMIEPLAAAAVVDAWISTNPRSPHAPTCGIHDHEQWPEGPHCRDFFFLTGEATAQAVAVDVATDASDHQPLMLDLR